LFWIKSVTKSVAPTGTANENDNFFIADQINPVLDKLISACWLKRHWVPDNVLKVYLKIDALWQLCDWIIFTPVEPLFGPLINLLVFSVTVKGVLLKLMVNGNVLGTVWVHNLVLVYNFVHKVF
jgi:hypothetical protein